MRIKKSKSVFITGVEDGSDYRIGVYPLWRLKHSWHFLFHLHISDGSFGPIITTFG